MYGRGFGFRIEAWPACLAQVMDVITARVS